MHEIWQENDKWLDSSYNYKELQLIQQKQNPDIFPGKLPAAYHCLSVPSLNRFEDSTSNHKKKWRVSKVKKKYIPDHSRRHAPVKVLYAIKVKSVSWDSYALLTVYVVGVMASKSLLQCF